MKISRINYDGTMNDIEIEKLTKNLSQYSDIKVYENINQELEKIFDAKN